MKIYFPDDPIKKEMLKSMISAFKQNDHRCDECIIPSGCSCFYNIIRTAIEKATGKPIEEVTK
jgi:hypothetical protein